MRVVENTLAQQYERSSGLKALEQMAGLGLLHVTGWITLFDLWTLNRHDGACYSYITVCACQ